MLKKRVLPLVVLLIICSVVGIGYTGYAEETVKILVNGKEITSDVPAQIIDGRTMVPVRYVAEALGAKVDWVSNFNRVTITTGPQRSYNLLKVNGEQTTWPYWYEDGHLYLEYRNAIELLRICHSTLSISYSTANNILIMNNASYSVPCVTKDDFKAISVTFLSYNRNLINCDFDPSTENLTLLPVK